MSQGASAAASTVAEETADDAVFDLAIDDVEELDLDGEDADPDIEVPSPDVETTAPDLPAEKVAAVDVLLDLELEAPGAESGDATMRV